ncbi:polysaccharide deacetylase family protein [Hyphomonas sp. FCG-A18]|uniref:polysaccharide deacetylase family protein n=1 Tax=Hyphomonas sp. FCG-A18 TaxID=3080019 RepID=UPI002B29DF43|nr:polysaccharide deacetylase family protein [Hyphomonas sp. FCG-A18]
MLDPSKYSPDRSIPAKIKRRLTLWHKAKPMLHMPQRGIVTFTFDDFPKSAAQHGMDILGKYDVSGTYYTCTGMLGHTNVMGEMYDEGDLDTLIKAGHEIGSHTHTHLDCAQVSRETVREEIETNLGALAQMTDASPRHFAWPYGETTKRNKAGMDDLITTARGILPGINRKGSDLMQLTSFELTPDQWTSERAAKAIETTARGGGWTIIFTHDVREACSPFGTMPKALEGLVRQARDAGLDILPMAEAYNQIQAEAA